MTHRRERGLTPVERLAWHREKSGPPMEGLRKWADRQLAERLGLTLFLRG